MRLMVDGVFFQLASSGIARVWKTLLPRLAASGAFEVFVLDRGDTPDVQGATIVPFPSYGDRYTADDSLLLQKVCDHFRIDVFTSTYYTAPVSTPMLMLVYDMIPELLDFDLSQRFWKEKEMAISFARRFISISHNTKRDLLRFYPEIAEDRIAVAHPGYDAAVFKPRDAGAIRQFRTRIGLDRPYVLLVGSREQHKGYKNAKLLFEAIGRLDPVGFDLLCVGGEPKIEARSLALVPKDCRVLREDLDDDDLASAYSGAVALVYPSLYEGFGLPVLEAMASGCPVITTTHGSLAEIAGDGACLTVGGSSVSEMIRAMTALEQPETRARLVAAGLERAKQFSWDALTDAIGAEADSLVREAKSGAFKSFFADWRRLRTVQASVDTEGMRPPIEPADEPH